MSLERRKEEMSDQFPELDELFGESFNPKKTIRLEKDVDQDNKERELGNYKAIWTELRNPETKGVVEANIYIPRGEKVDKVLIVGPGYRGDFVLQEADYADDFAKDGRALIVYRYNGLKINEKTQNELHCPQRAEIKSDKDYLGEREFNFEECNRQVKTILKALSDKVNELDKIDFVAHSLAARNVLLTVSDLFKSLDESGSAKGTVQKVVTKIDNIVLLGAWLETRKDKIWFWEQYLPNEQEREYLEGFDVKRFFGEAEKSSEKLENMTAESFPEKTRIIGIQSVGDQHVDLEGEYMKFFDQLKNAKERGTVILKDLKDQLPTEIGGRETEMHDYAHVLVRKWIKQIIR